jgi:phage tail-like protein
MSDSQAVSSYLQYLPAIFHQDPFIGRFLLAFEAILSDPDNAEQPSLEAKIGQLATYFDPRTTPGEFLPWLAGWVALSLRADWDIETQRSFIQEIVPLYRLRGTSAGLKRMLEIYTRNENVVIYDAFDEPAHFFQVQLTLSEANPDLLRAKQAIARAIIDQEKPAHTFYALKVAVPTMRLVSLDLRRAERNQPRLLFLGHVPQNLPQGLEGTITVLGTSMG